jgi:CDGSH-type Zn-finger protein
MENIMRIKARENGPYLVEGTALYQDGSGQEQKTSGKSIALCRCGGSSNKPFCDGTHRKIDFQADGIELEIV